MTSETSRPDELISGELLRWIAYSQFESFDRWLDQLPMANAPKICEIFRELLNTSHDLELKIEVRLEMLERIASRYEIVASVLDVRFLEKKLPYDHRADSVAGLGLQCNRSFARGFAMVIENPSFSDLEVERQRAVMCRYFSFQSAVLLKFTQCYKPVESGFWLANFRIFKRAESLGLTASDCSPAVTGSDLVRMIRQMLIFSICPTGNYPQRDHQRLFNIIGKFADLSFLSGSVELENEKSRFFVDFRRDQSLQHLRHYRSVSVDEPRFLFTAKMVESMIEVIRDPSHGRAVDGRNLSADKPLIAMLARVLAAPRRRQAIRVEEDERRNVLVGMKSIVDFSISLQEEVGGRVPGDRREQSAIGGPDSRVYLYGGLNSGRVQSKLKYIDVPELNLVPLEDAFFADPGRQGCGASAGFSGRPSSWGAKVAAADIWKDRADGKSRNQGAPVKETGDKIAAHLVNSSIRGFGVVWSKEMVSRIQVGELVGLPVDQERIELGIVRRIFDRGDQLLLGVELVSAKVKSAKICGFQAKDRTLRGLRFQSDLADGPVESILIQNVGLRTGDRIRIEDYAERRLGSLREKSPGYSIFELIRPEAFVQKEVQQRI